MKRKIAIVDTRIPWECERALTLRGYYVIKLPPSHRLGEAVASHPDMLIARLGEDYVTTTDYLDEAAFAIQDIYDTVHPHFHFADEVHGGCYPADAILNSLVMGRRIFLRKESASPYLLSLARERGYEIVGVKQGYAACTVLKLSEEAAITADGGMARALTECGIRVYKIENGGISLPPYEYGFIGGASGVDGGCVYTLGSPEGHPSYEVIKAATAAEGLTLVPLGRGMLRDLGGILFCEGDL